MTLLSVIARSLTEYIGW